MKRSQLTAVVAGLVLGAASAGTAAATNPWEPLGSNGPQRITLHILPTSHGRESVLDPNVAIIPDVPVILTVVNASREFHSFTIPRLHLNAVVMPGSPAHPRATTIRFTAPQGGAYGWHCDFCPAVHHQGGMRGTLYALVAG